MMIRALTEQGGRVVVGGSDALAEPAPYLEAGAELIVRDKSGAANLAALAHVLGNDHPEPLAGVMLRSGEQLPPRRPPMSPENWPLPDVGILRQCQGQEYWESPLPERLLPVGSVMLDIG